MVVRTPEEIEAQYQGELHGAGRMAYWIEFSERQGLISAEAAEGLFKLYHYQRKRFRENRDEWLKSLEEEETHE